MGIASIIILSILKGFGSAILSFSSQILGPIVLLYVNWWFNKHYSTTSTSGNRNTSFNDFNSIVNELLKRKFVKWIILIFFLANMINPTLTAYEDYKKDNEKKPTTIHSLTISKDNIDTLKKLKDSGIKIDNLEIK